MTSVTAHGMFCYSPPLYNAKLEKTTTEDEFENYGFFRTILYIVIEYISRTLCPANKQHSGSIPRNACVACET